jgi:hypothetical protein
MNEQGRPLFRDTLMSIIGVAMVLAMVMFVDNTVRQDVVDVLHDPPAAVLDDASARTEDLATTFMAAVRGASTEQTVLFMFVASAAVLTFYMGRR